MSQIEGEPEGASDMEPAAFERVTAEIVRRFTPPSPAQEEVSSRQEQEAMQKKNTSIGNVLEMC